MKKCPVCGVEHSDIVPVCSICGSPLLRGEGTLEEKITGILTEREPKYEDAADRTLDTDGLTVKEVAEKIIRLSV